jgi:hypothetical protein
MLIGNHPKPTLRFTRLHLINGLPATRAKREPKEGRPERQSSGNFEVRSFQSEGPEKRLLLIVAKVNSTLNLSGVCLPKVLGPSTKLRLDRDARALGSGLVRANSILSAKRWGLVRLDCTPKLRHGGRPLIGDTSARFRYVFIDKQSLSRGSVGIRGQEFVARIRGQTGLTL